MSISKERTLLYEAIICSLGLMMFSFFIHFGLPLRLISFASLVIPAYIIGKNLKSFSDLKMITGLDFRPKNILLWSLIGLTIGLLLAAFYRWYLDETLFPSFYKSFALVAATIGIMEELVFRGYIQGSLKDINPVLSVLFSTVAHTGYKCCLFLAPFNGAETDIGFLAFWTFVAGIIFGTIRHLSGSIVPSLTAHALFDILVYGEFLNAPWWVW